MSCLAPNGPRLIRVSPPQTPCTCHPSPLDRTAKRMASCIRSRGSVPVTRSSNHPSLNAADPAVFPILTRGEAFGENYPPDKTTSI